MRIACLNPQGNFDPGDFGWTQHPDFGGQLVYVKELSLALGRLGHGVDVITRRIEDPAWPTFSASRDGYPGHENVRILRFPCGPPGFLPKEELWPHLKEWIGNILAFYDQERSFPDVLTGHYADGGLAAVLLQEQRGTPLTFTGHSLGAQKMDKIILGEEDFSKAVQTFHFDRRIAAERISMARAARIITSTEQERAEQYAHRLYRGAVDPAAPGKFAVIPPGVNLEIFGLGRRSEAEEQIAERVEKMLERDIPAERRDLATVVCSSRLDAKKNHRGLIGAWVRSEELRRTANLLIVTRGVGQIREGGLQGCVSAFDLNSQEELAACYRYLGRSRRGIFTLTSVYEPFGLAPLEAMAAGLPAVVTGNGGPRESLQDQDGAYGILVDPEDPGDITRGLLELAADETRRQEMRTRGRRRVMDRYTWERTAQGYLEQFLQILGGADGGNREFEEPENAGTGWLKKMYYGTEGSE
jgi:sucrose-phosphate synthase